MCSGPSGVGKNTIINALRALEVFNHNFFSVSWTTRSPRPGEVHCVDYIFVTRTEFEAGIANGEFLEYAKVGDSYYGTPLAPIQSALEDNMTVFIDLDVQGAKIAKRALDAWEPRPLPVWKQKVPVFDVFIAPPSIDDLEARLRARGTETESQILARLDRAKDELLQANHFTCSVVNDNFDECVDIIVRMWKRHHDRIDDESCAAV
jgi:guanylate kinase